MQKRILDLIVSGKVPSERIELQKRKIELKAELEEINDRLEMTDNLFSVKDSSCVAPVSQFAEEELKGAIANLNGVVHIERVMLEKGWIVADYGKMICDFHEPDGEYFVFMNMNDYFVKWMVENDQSVESFADAHNDLWDEWPAYSGTRKPRPNGVICDHPNCWFELRPRMTEKYVQSHYLPKIMNIGGVVLCNKCHERQKRTGAYGNLIVRDPFIVEKYYDPIQRRFDIFLESATALAKLHEKVPPALSE